MQKPLKVDPYAQPVIPEHNIAMRAIREPSTIIKLSEQAKERLMQGVELVYKCVSPLLGPTSKNACYTRQWNHPIIVHDGVTIAKEVNADDPMAQMGVELVREAAKKTVSDVGDATTSTIVLTYEMCKKGMESEYNKMKMRKQMIGSIRKIRKAIKSQSAVIEKDAQLLRIATISSASKDLGELVVEAIQKVGETGLVTVEESGTHNTYVQHTTGLTLDKGYVSQYFITNPQTQEAVLKDPKVLIFENRVTDSSDLLSVLTELTQKHKTFFIVGDIQGDALALLIENKIKGNINVLVVPPSLRGDLRIPYLQDISALTGAKIISNPRSIDNPSEYIGSIEKVVATRSNTMLVGESANKDIYVKNLQNQLVNSSNPYEVEQLKERIANLTTGVSVVKVGGKTSVEQRETVERVKDAIGAVVAAKDEGIVAGGGITYHSIAQKLDDSVPGEAVVKHALVQIIPTLLRNSGNEDMDWERIIKVGKVYDVEGERECYPIKNGIIDPAKAVRSAIENAIYVSSSILTTDVLINNHPYAHNS